MNQPTPGKPNKRWAKTLHCKDITALSPGLEDFSALKSWTPPMLVELDSTDIASGQPTLIVEGSSGGVVS
jgi:hypothetical protein